MWQAHPAQREILSGMRQAAGVVLLRAMSGIEWVVEAYGCSAQSLRDPAVLQNLFSRIIREMKLRPVGKTQWHQFPGTGGITGLCPLAESFLAPNGISNRFCKISSLRIQFRSAGCNGLMSRN